MYVTLENKLRLTGMRRGMAAITVRKRSNFGFASSSSYNEEDEK